MKPVEPVVGPLPAAGSEEAPLSVLLLSASMGAGHDGAAREIADRLRNAGHHAVVRDCLDAGPLHCGSALRSGYEFELRHAPGAYDATYRFWYRAPWLRDPLASLITFLARRRVLRWVRELDADAVVSTYPLVTLVLGHLRATGRLSIPVVNFITDFGVHPLWVHPGVDLNLAVHAGPAEMAARRSKRPSEACGPAVSATFAPGPHVTTRRRRIRSELGLDQADRAVLIVAGSWGVGGVLDTFRAASFGEGVVPVVVCGHDHKLRTRVEQEAAALGIRAVILGWSDGMAELMAGCDALVENAGGLTSLEAMRAGLPVVSYRPIAGHGRENTAAMAAAGVSRLASSAGDLATTLSEVTRAGPVREGLIRRGQAMFRTDPTAHIVAAARATVPARASGHRPLRVEAAAAALTRLSRTGVTTGALDARR
jgi:processive 1,2-diacylglycerol beta-glucosyltransferase